MLKSRINVSVINICIQDSLIQKNSIYYIQKSFEICILLSVLINWWFILCTNLTDPKPLNSYLKTSVKVLSVLGFFLYMNLSCFKCVDQYKINVVILWMMVCWARLIQKNLTVSVLGHGLMTLYRVYFGLCWLADMEVLQTHHSDLLGLCRQSALHRATLRQHKGNDISPTTPFTHRYLITPPDSRPSRTDYIQFEGHSHYALWQIIRRLFNVSQCWLRCLSLTLFIG